MRITCFSLSPSDKQLFFWGLTTVSAVTYVIIVFILESTADGLMSGHPSNGVQPMLVQCWATVVDGGPTLNQHWLDTSYLLGILFYAKESNIKRTISTPTFPNSYTDMTAVSTELSLQARHIQAMLVYS